jgi:hypothetical protein
MENKIKVIIIIKRLVGQLTIKGFLPNALGKKNAPEWSKP